MRIWLSVNRAKTHARYTLTFSYIFMARIGLKISMINNNNMHMRSSSNNGHPRTPMWYVQLAATVSVGSRPAVWQAFGIRSGSDRVVGACGRRNCRVFDKALRKFVSTRNWCVRGRRFSREMR